MFSAVGRLLMFSGAMGNERILPETEEEWMDSVDLTVAMMEKTLVAREGHIPISEQYKIKYQEQLEILEEGGSLQLEELRLPEYNHEKDGDEEKMEGIKKEE
ncbi:hypothetical protein ACHAWF_001544 [Thalassiosira exigua]